MGRGATAPNKIANEWHKLRREASMLRLEARPVGDQKFAKVAKNSKCHQVRSPGEGPHGMQTDRVREPWA